MTHRPSPFRIGDAPSAALRTVWAPTPTGGRAQDRATAVHAGALGAVSAVDSQDGPGDIGGVRAGEEDDAGSDLLRPAVSAQSRGGKEQRGGFAVGGIHIGVDESRLNDVDRDAAVSEIAGGASAVGFKGGLGGCIVGHPAEYRSRSRSRADADDQTAVVQDREGCANPRD